MLTIKSLKVVNVARRAMIKVISLQPHFLGCINLILTHNLMAAHVNIMKMPIDANTIRTGRMLYGLTKLGVTPGGGGRAPIWERTDSGSCESWMPGESEAGLLCPRTNGAMVVA